MLAGDGVGLLHQLHGGRPGWAEWIAWQLEAAGYTTVLQAWDFTVGSDWVHKMQNAAKDSRRTIVVLSDDYLRSVHGEAEWRVAYANDPTGEKGMLVPVRVAACEPPGLLKTRVFVDLVGLDEDAARAALLRAMEEGRAKPTLEPAYPGRATPRYPRAPAGDAAGERRAPSRENGERAHLETLLGVHERNVRILEKQEAQFAGVMPVHLAGQLEDEREAVDEIKRRLELGRRDS